MNSKLIAKTIHDFIQSKKSDDKLFIAMWLKEFGKIGQRLYKLNPTPELKKSILQVKKIIDNL